MCLQAEIKHPFHNPRSRQANPLSDLSREAVRVMTVPSGAAGALTVLSLLHYRLPVWPLAGRLGPNCNGTVWYKSFPSPAPAFIIPYRSLPPCASTLPAVDWGGTLPISSSIFLMLRVKRLLLLLLNSVTGVLPPCFPFPIL